MKFICFFLLPLCAYAQQKPVSLDPVIVTGKVGSLTGIATSASEGWTSAGELQDRPLLRRGELLESVPGVVITQHSGDGKANQYFVRGFNLDHGTDFSVSMDGQPVNFVTHAHGQGYADLNPIIPELVERLDYWKGPFFGEIGDLSTAGAARFRFYDALPRGIASVTVGENDFYRGMLADTVRWAGESGVTYAVEYQYYNGPWKFPSNSERMNGFLKYFKNSGEDRFSVTAMAYAGNWNSTDQVPKSLIDEGSLDRFGALDDSDGGNSQRFSLMAEWDRELKNGRIHADVYFGYYDLDLFSNFTYRLNDPVNGDQFEQQDGRYFFGGEVRREWDFGAKNKVTAGLQTRNDFIDDVGLYHTTNRERLETVRVDDVVVNSVGVFGTLDYQVNEWFRIQPGLRADVFRFDVSSDDPANSGTRSDGIVSPKLSLIFGPWEKTELCVNAGYGFHSNDARGVTISRDPETGDPADRVDPLVRTYGTELGVRTEAPGNVVSTLSVFYLHSDSELIYVGDAGNSEAGPATVRYGVEWSVYWKPEEWLMFDHEITLSEGRLQDVGRDDRIPGAVPLVWSAGLTVGKREGWFGSLRGRYFSPRPLIEDNSEKSRASFQVNSRVGYRRNDWEISLDCLNLLDRKDNDIEYYYESRAPGQVAAREDIHLHPAEPRTLRLSVTRYF
ncbi:MAG: TonB-dependent receptor plug domain-containing protein [Luteolibacter sp.]